MKLQAALLAALVATATWLAGPSGWVDAQPKATAVLPEDGAVISALPEIIHTCFSEQVVVLDDATFKFNVIAPDSRPLGLRIVFQPDGFGVDVYLGKRDKPPEGVWTFEWQVTGAASGEEASGETKFEVAPDGDAPPGEQERCTDPRTPSPQTPTPSGTPSNSDDGGGPDVAVIVLVAVVVVSLAAIIGSVVSIVWRVRGRGS